jgi:hypothetical protein
MLLVWADKFHESMALGSPDAAASCGADSARLQWLQGKGKRIYIVVFKERGLESTMASMNHPLK